MGYTVCERVEMPSHALIHSGVHFTLMDYRQHPTKESKGVLFICSFGAAHLLMGYDGKLWRLNSARRKGYKKDWPWLCTPNRLVIDISWIRPIFSDTRRDNRAYMGFCQVYEKRRRYCNNVHRGSLENLNHLLIRLQRWTRRMLHRARGLALCMVLHPRLGAKSLLAELGWDMLHLILSLKPSTPLFEAV